MADVFGTDAAEIIDAADGVTESLDRIWGYGGNDEIYALGGDDFIRGGAGADYIDGGVGVDAISLDESPSAVFVSLLTGSGVGGDANGDIYVSIEDIIGSPHDDFLVGDDGDNFINGIAGNNTIQGKGGNDDLTTQEGQDDISGGDGDDRIFSGGGSDTIDGGAGNDNLAGGTGDDWITGGEGDDKLEGDTGADMLDGGAGIDEVSYSRFFNSTATGITISLIAGTAPEGDTLIDIENVVGSFHNDTIIGDGNVNLLNGGFGNDAISGLAGADILIGSDGNDVLIGGTGGDQLLGGDGTDRAAYTKSNAAVTVNLTLGTGLGGHANGDVLTDIEDVFGSAFNDLLTGSAGGSNRLSGLGGNDVLDGAGGDDRLQGGDGNDVLIGGAGADALNGGAGSDRADYSASNAAVTVNLRAGNAAGGHADGDTLAAVESVSGSKFGDALLGNAAANRLLGQGGDDLLIGSGGNDILSGGAGADEIYGGTGADRFDYNRITESGPGVAARDTIGDFQQGLDLFDLATIDANTTIGGNQAFTFIGTAAFSAPGQVRYAQSGGNTIVVASNDADTNAEMAFTITGLFTLTESDFVL